MYNPSSENKGADQLRGYREADLCLCFRLCRLLVFPRGGSNTDRCLNNGNGSICKRYYSMQKPQRSQLFCYILGSFHSLKGSACIPADPHDQRNMIIYILGSFHSLKGSACIFPADPHDQRNMIIYISLGHFTLSKDLRVFFPADSHDQRNMIIYILGSFHSLKGSACIFPS